MPKRGRKRELRGRQVDEQWPPFVPSPECAPFLRVSKRKRGKPPSNAMQLFDQPETEAGALFGGSATGDRLARGSTATAATDDAREKNRLSSQTLGVTLAGLDGANDASFSSQLRAHLLTEFLRGSATRMSSPERSCSWIMLSRPEQGDRVERGKKSSKKNKVILQLEREPLFFERGNKMTPTRSAFFLLVVVPVTPRALVVFAVKEQEANSSSQEALFISSLCLHKVTRTGVIGKKGPRKERGRERERVGEQKLFFHFALSFPCSIVKKKKKKKSK